jgi:nicotinamide mononucleotide transporter
MHWHEWYTLFLAQMKETTPLQWAAVFFSLAEVLLARVNNVWLYPTGILGTFIFLYPLIDAKLYADCALNVYYIVMSFYGWYYWIKKADKPPVKISWSGRTEWAVAIAMCTAGTAFLYWCLTVGLGLIFKNYTPSNVPFWDAWISATAWAGMWLLARRKIENWVLLNLSNIFAVPLYFYKSLPLFGCLTIVFFVIGTWGFFDWIRIFKKEKAGLAPKLSVAS